MSLWNPWKEKCLLVLLIFIFLSFSMKLEISPHFPVVFHERMCVGKEIPSGFWTGGIESKDLQQGAGITFSFFVLPKPLKH